MRIEAGRLLVEADETGRLTAVALRRPRLRMLLAEVDLGGCRIGGEEQEIDWAARRVTLDEDEIGVRVSGGDLEVQLRHSFSTGWTTRLLIVNTAAAPRVVDRLQLIARPAPDRRVSALAAGSRLCWAMQAADGGGPLLTARLMSGAVNAVTDQGFELGRLRLAPGQRYVTQLRWELLATPRSVVTGPGRDVLLARTAYGVDEAVLLPDDPDSALVAPREVGVDVVDEPGAHGRELFAPGPGRHRVELRSADGDIRLDLSWVSPLPDQLDDWATELLAGPRTSAGVVSLDGPGGSAEAIHAALVVQAALGGGRLVDAELAADALDRRTAQLLDLDGEVPTDPLTVLYLLGEHGRTGDPDVLDLALSLEASQLASEGTPPPGLGLAVLRTVLAGVDAQARVAPLVIRAVERVTALAERHQRAADASELADADEPAADASEPAADPGFAQDAESGFARAAELELLLAVRPLLPPDHPAHAWSVVLTRALGAAVGAGLPGRLVSPPPVAQQAHLLAVLRLLPEDDLDPGTPSWGASPPMLAHRLTLEVLDRLTGPGRPGVGAAAAWLCLGQGHA